MMKPVYCALALLPFLLTGCTAVGLATGAGATVGVAAAQEGGLKRAISDTRIQATINDLWLRHDLEMFSKLNLTINQGRVLITGVVQNPEDRVEAVRLAWQATGVKEVINEIRVAKSGGVTGFARDTWITARLRTALTFDKRIQSINYSIDTVQGTVYLMGVAQNQSELNRAIEVARTIPDVKQVVSYVKLAGENVSSSAPSSLSKNPVPGYNSNDYSNTHPAPGPAPVLSDDDMTMSPPTSLIPQPVQSEPVGGGY